MTPKQREHFNRMLLTLKRISKEYQSIEKLRRNAERDYGLGYEEALEMSYENIQQEATHACKGVKTVVKSS